ncbi:MAG: S8 family serine peptidase [Gemmatimonadales bacterium]
MTRHGVPALLTVLALFAAACDRPGPTQSRAPGPIRADVAGADGKSVLVGFAASPDAAAVALIEGVGGRVTYRYKYIPVLAAIIPTDQEDVLKADASVAYVEDDIPMHPLGGKQITDYGVSLIEAPGAWALGFRGQGIKVGIFDSGIDIDHPDLTVVGGFDLVGDGNGLDDCQGHGTHVAGIVAARDNGNHTVGVAPSVELYAMRFADCTWSGATLAKMIQGVEWAIDNGMNVVNMSFGFGLAGVVSSPLSPSQAAEDAFAEAHARGVVLIAASGNSSTPYVGFPAAYESVIAVGATDDADNLATFSQYGTEQELTAPGVNNLSSYLVGQGQETSLTVDTDNDRELEAIAMQFAGMTRKKGISADAVYAGFGTAVEFAGVDCAGKTAVISRGGGTFAEKAEAAMNAGCVAAVIHNHTPGNFNGTLGSETTSDGRAWIPVVSISLEDGLYLKDQIESRPTRVTLINSTGNLAIFSGTSMASPHAAGVAALVLSRNPTLSPEQVRTILRASANDLGVPGWDPLFGYGRVNARRAVEATP